MRKSYTAFFKREGSEEIQKVCKIFSSLQQARRYFPDLVNVAVLLDDGWFCYRVIEGEEKRLVHISMVGDPLDYLEPGDPEQNTFTMPVVVAPVESTIEKEGK